MPLTYDVESIYDAYLAAPLPDTSATDIAAALTYTKDLFTNPETSKIVLITDGKETDESALGIIGTVSAQGTKVDTAYIATSFEKEDIQVTGVPYPDYYVGVGDECPIGVCLQSNGHGGVPCTTTGNSPLRRRSAFPPVRRRFPLPTLLRRRGCTKCPSG